MELAASMNSTSHLVGGVAMAPPSEDSMRFPLYMRIAGTLVCMIIFTIGVTGNLLVPLVVIKTKYLRNSTNLFLINLSIADLLVLIVCMPTMLIELHSRPETWLLGEPMCKVTNYVETLAANGSISTILAISFERYYAICKPLKAGYKCTRLRAAIIICVIWILASILSSPIYIMAKSSQVEYETDKSMVYNCILETDTYWSKMYVFVSMFAFFCLPLLVLMLVYWLISRRLIRENVAMVDSSTTRNHLTDSRGNIAQSSHHQHHAQLAPTDKGDQHHHKSLNILHLRRPDNKRTSSSGALCSLYNSIRHYNYYGQNTSRHNDNRDLDAKKDTLRSKFVLMAPFNAANRISAQMSADHAHAGNGGLSRPPALGKALSLDYGASKITSRAIDNVNHAMDYEPMSEIRAANGQSTWSANSVVFHSRTNTDSSNAEVTTTATNSTSMGTDIQRNLGQGSSSTSPATTGRKTSLPTWIFSSHLGELMAQLWGKSSRLKATVNQDKTTDNAKSESAPGNDIIAGDLQQGHASAAHANFSTKIFCDNVSINGHHTTGEIDNVNVDVIEREPDDPGKHDDQSDMPLMQSNNIISYVGDSIHSLDSNESDGLGKQKIDRMMTVDGIAIDTANSRQLYRRDTGADSQTGKFNSRRRTKRSLESKKPKHSAQDSRNQSRSRFKWVKGFSVSSSIGSTYTNSTFLPSETGSISPSLHNSSSRQQSSSSPTRPTEVGMNRTASVSIDTGGVELNSNQSPLDGSGGGGTGSSRSCSPEKLHCSDRGKKVTHFDEVVDVSEIDLSSSHPSKLTHARVPENCNTNSDSCSASAVNTSGSDRSLSPAGSLSSAPAHEMSNRAKSSWLESIGSCEQHDIHYRLLHRSLVQPRRLSQHDEEEQIDTTSLVSKYSSCQNKRSITDIYRECDEREGVRPPVSGTIDSRRNTRDLTYDEAQDFEGASDVTSCMKPMTPKGGVVRSLTEDRAPLQANYDEIDRIKLFPIHAGLTPLQHQYDLDTLASRTSARHSIVNAHKHINKVNLIAMAQNLSDNLHFKRHKQRSGSHPIVSHHMQIHNESNGGTHTEFLAVRDVSKRQQMDSRRQVVAMLAFVVACFFLLFLPYRVFTIWLILSTEEQVQSLGMETYYNIVYFARTLIYLHSAINPIAYNLISTKFRRAFMSILLCRGPATRRNFTADPHKYFPYDSKGQLNANQNRSTGITNGNNGDSKGPRSPRGPTR